MVELDVGGVAVQDTDDDRLSVHGHVGRDPQVHIMAHHLRFDPAVLVLSLLGDVEPADHLHARCDRRSKGPRQVRLVLKDPVDPVADLDLLLLRLDVDVARALFDRIRDDVVDDIDDAVAVLCAVPFADDQALDGAAHVTLEIDLHLLRGFEGVSRIVLA